MDKLYHFLLCLIITLLFDWRIGVTVGLTIEGTQAEGYWRERGELKNYWWNDTFLDLVFDAIGIVVGMGLRKIIGI